MSRPSRELDPEVHRHLTGFAATHGADAILLQNLVTFAAEPRLVGQPPDLAVLHAIVRTLYAHWYVAEGHSWENQPVYSFEAGTCGLPHNVWRVREDHFRLAVGSVLRSFHGPLWLRCLRHVVHWSTFKRFPAPPTARWYRQRSTALRDTWGV
ncbi:MAG: hypothetical protein Q7S23_05090 [bacterium]|nr:hypothetical protein [bacterium]